MRMETWLFVFLLCGPVFGVRVDFHTGLTPEELQTYFGVQDKGNVPEYEVISPEHKEGSRKRLSWLETKSPVQYDLKAFGEDFNLYLEHNHILIAPGCLTHYVGQNGTRTTRPCPTRDDDCYYHGMAINHNHSQVSLSICQGLHGLIRIPNRDHDLWIQPIAERHVTRARRSTRLDLTHPHLIFKRAAKGHHAVKRGSPEVEQLVKEVTSVSRARRSVGDKYAEMLLVADKTMHQQHKDKLRDYLLTVANVASRILLDPSIGTPLHFTVVNIQILEDDQPDLAIIEDAGETLDSFCLWQERSNPRDDSNTRHHDGAALFTKVNLVYNDDRHTTGLGTLAGMCGVNTRCSINQDDGLGVGITLAHETGHTVGMSHDGDGNDCENGKYIMASMGGGGHTAMQWSACSQRSFATFLQSSKSSCLDDHPQTSVELPKDLPGVLYHGTDQCELFLGPGATLCEGNVEDECTHLRCFDPSAPETCRVDAAPRMDGTMCGERKYCLSGQCVDIGPNGPPPQHGGWSAWEAQWSECSRSCGGGVRIRRRKCDNPKPALGGHDCIGDHAMAEMCNMQACSSSEEEFRKSQCALTDSVPYSGQLKHWLPVQGGGEGQCELYCVMEGQRTCHRRYMSGRSWYQDGTSCSVERASFGKCVDGKCVAFGCDGKTGSLFRFDQCGVCGGQGNTCTKHSGKYNQGTVHEYVKFVTVPKGSTAVKMTNTNTFTMMSVRVGGRRALNLNPDGPADSTGTYNAGNMLVDYQGGSSLETISMDGPLEEEVDAEVYCKFSATQFQGMLPNISYEYFVPTLHPEANYQWKVQNTDCSKTCGGGVYNRIITCTQKSNGAEVDDHDCDLREKPRLTGPACNNQPCPPRWRTGHYDQCSTTCGGGQQTRVVDCVQLQAGSEQVVAPDTCPANQKPAATRGCNSMACPAAWVTSHWSSCSLTCGRGIRTRTVKCMDRENQLEDSACGAGVTKPTDTQSCVTTVCSPQISGDACKDGASNCENYGLKLCQDYGEFAHQNCMKTCAFCSSPDITLTAEVCEDRNADCSGYEKSVCTEFADWAKQNCAKMCGLCTGCEDKNSDCARYGQSVCTGQYAEWATDNCAKLCGHCGTGTGTGSQNGGGSSGGGSGGNGTSYEACVDQSGDCAGYGRDICTGQYAEWASINCAKLCGQCTSGDSVPDGGDNGGVSNGGSATSTQGVCGDKIDNCAGYGQSVCTGTYAEWASDNCRKFCGHCQGSGGTTTATTHSALSEDCTDKITNCAAYGQSVCTGTYAEWASDNCNKFCGLCSSPTSHGNSCVDSSADCQRYGNSVCTSYAPWAAENCQHFCHLCSHRRRRRSSSMLIPPPRGLCNNVLTSAEGSLSLIGQPLESLCTNIITAPIGSRLQLDFSALAISCKDGDFLEVKEEGGKVSKLGKGADREMCERPAPVQWTTAGNIVTIALTVGVPGHGYNLSYTVAPGSHNHIGCEQLLTNPSGAVSSPGFPAPYPNSTLCLTTIIAPATYTLLLHFNLFQLDGDRCGDTVTVYDEEFGTKDVFCGTRNDLQWQSKGNKVKVVFASDQEQDGRGFLASYRFTSP